MTQTLPCFLHGLNTILGKITAYPAVKKLISDFALSRDVQKYGTPEQDVHWYGVSDGGEDNCLSSAASICDAGEANGE